MKRQFDGLTFQSSVDNKGKWTTWQDWGQGLHPEMRKISFLNQFHYFTGLQFTTPFGGSGKGGANPTANCGFIWEYGDFGSALQFTKTSKAIAAGSNADSKFGIDQLHKKFWWANGPLAFSGGFSLNVNGFNAGEGKSFVDLTTQHSALKYKLNDKMSFWATQGGKKCGGSDDAKGGDAKFCFGNSFSFSSVYQLCSKSTLAFGLYLSQDKNKGCKGA